MLKPTMQSLCVLLALALGCQGTIDEPENYRPEDPNRPPDRYDPENPPPATDPPCLVDCDPEEPPRPAQTSAFPRLSHPQWENTVTDLLYLETRPGTTATFEDDPSGTTFFDNNSTVLQVTPNLWADYQRGAEELSAVVLGDARILGELRRGTEGDVRATVAQFLTRAFRRPATEAEISSHVTLHANGPAYFDDVPPNDAGLALVIQAALQSPEFLYRPEEGEVTEGVIALNDYQLASRLSYMLWDSMPDAMLIDAAAAGELSSGDGLREHASRMLDDNRAREKFADFHQQLFETDTFDFIQVEGLSDAIGDAMREETERFVDHVIYEQDGSLRELLTAPYSFVNDELAELYGLSGSFGAEFERTELDPTQRAGVLTQPGFLASHKGDVAPILRGVFVNLHVLCSDLPEPPVFDPPTFEGPTRRERVDNVTGPGTCGETCHGILINPIGFAFESFDDDGRFRTTDNGIPVDVSASFAFDEGVESYDGPVELAEKMASTNNAHRCYVQNWLEFAFGRPIQSGDGPLVRSVATSSREAEWSVKEMLVAMIDSEIFRTRAVQVEMEEE